MANRYRNIGTKKTSTNKLVYNTVEYPTIQPILEDIYIITEVGDRLDNLAGHYYGDTSLWVVIANVNNVGKGTMFLDAGIQLRIIPNPDVFMNNIK